MTSLQPPLKYHRAVLNLLGIAAERSDLAASTLREIELRDAFTFPESVFEWYSIDGADKILMGNGEDQILSAGNLARLPWMEYVRGDEVSRGPIYPGEAESEIALWTAEGYTARPVTDILGTIDIGSDREGITGPEVILDGSADPPVYDLGVSSWPDWHLREPQFSGFIFHWCAWNWLRTENSESIWMEAPAKWPADALLERIGRELSKGPQYAAGPLYRSLWFYASGAVLQLSDPNLSYGCNDPSHDAVWTLIARDEESLELLRSRLDSAIGTRLRFFGRG